MFGSYNKSQFMLEFNSNIVFPGDFHRYIFWRTAENYIRRPDQKKDVLRKFLTDDSLSELSKESETGCESDEILASVNSIYHELTHYMQGLSSGSELLRDILEDQIAACALNEMQKCGSEKTSLHAPAYNKLDKNGSSEHTFHKLNDIYQSIYNTYVTINMDDGEKFDLCAEDLLEGYAALKSYYWMMVVEPEEFRDAYTKVNQPYFNENLSDTYKKAWMIYKKLTPFERSDNYRIGEIPSIQTVDVYCFPMLCDISLHIPLFLDYEYDQTSDGKIPEYCCPHVRFIRALNTLTRNNGFPDAVDGVNFYITLYDFIALDNGWPTFQEVNEKWIRFLRFRLATRFMTSDLYRWISLKYKIQFPTKMIITEPPVQFFSQTGIPVFIKYISNDNDFSGEKNFFEYTYIWNNTTIPVMDDQFFSPMKDPYNIMTQKCHYNYWNFTDVLRVMELGDLTHMLELHPTFLREIYCRIISKSFFNAVIQEPEFSCPVIDLNCKARQDECACLKNLIGLPEHCCLKVWLHDMKISPESVIWA